MAIKNIPSRLIDMPLNKPICCTPTKPGLPKLNPPSTIDGFEKTGKKGIYTPESLGLLPKNPGLLPKKPELLPINGDLIPIPYPLEWLNKLPKRNLVKMPEIKTDISKILTPKMPKEAPLPPDDALRADPQYQHALEVLSNPETFDKIAGKDGTISRMDLIKALLFQLRPGTQTDADVLKACQYLLKNPKVFNIMDYAAANLTDRTGLHTCPPDGRIEKADIESLWADLRGAPVAPVEPVDIDEEERLLET